jgi:hypothetical protein
VGFEARAAEYIEIIPIRGAAASWFAPIGIGAQPLRAAGRVLRINKNAHEHVAIGIEIGLPKRGAAFACDSRYLYIWTWDLLQLHTV